MSEKYRLKPKSQACKQDYKLFVRLEGVKNNNQQYYVIFYAKDENNEWQMIDQSERAILEPEQFFDTCFFAKYKMEYSDPR